MTTNRLGQRATTAVLAILSTVTLTACTGDDAAPDTAPNADGGRGTAAPAPDDPNRGAEQRRLGRAEGSIVLGDLNPPQTAKQVGAPFDPCGLAWTDFPADVRPTDGRKIAPVLAKPKPGESWKVVCNYDLTDLIDIQVGGSATAQPPPPKRFTAQVVWQSEPLSDPASVPGATAKTIGGKPGYLKAVPPDPKAGDLCMGAVGLSTGAAAVFITNAKFPAKPSCEIAETLLGAIAGKSQ